MSRKDLDDDGRMPRFRSSHHQHVLLSLLSDDRRLQRHKEVTVSFVLAPSCTSKLTDLQAVTPSAYNHPRFYTEESIHQAHSKLPVLLTQPKNHEPSLYRAVVLSEDSFVHNTVPSSIAALQTVDAQSNQNDDCVSGVSRGRSSHRLLPGHTMNRPRATHAQNVVNNTRRMSSVPAVYDETRHLPLRTSRESPHNVYRRDSMMRLAKSGAFSKTLGIGEGHFTPADLFVKAHELEQQREDQMIVKKKVKIIRDYLMHHGDQKFQATNAEVLKYFFRRQPVVSCGSLHITSPRQQDEDAAQIQHVDNLKLAKKTKEKDRGWSKAQGKAGPNNDFEPHARMAEKIAQNDDITAKLHIPIVKNTNNYSRLIIRVNYIDKAVKQ